ncbi:unnamed protein product [Blepharisma stoltei]|uniref:Ion transport domain-containing protein n=1 Tax=Blepharisma stoltei TaxID=1481888 RepID=A0AAU9J702_9CILI|nr:unnamed protein product [Blepharisma stoltei]
MPAILFASTPYTLHLWIFDGLKRIKITFADEIIDFRMSPKARWIMIWIKSVIKIISSEKLELVYEIENSQPKNWKFSKNSEKIAYCYKKNAVIFDIQTRNLIKLKHSNLVRKIKFTSDIKYIFTGCEDCSIRIWNIEKQKNIFVYYTNIIPMRLKLDEYHGRLFYANEFDLAILEHPCTNQIKKEIEYSVKDVKICKRTKLLFFLLENFQIQIWNWELNSKIHEIEWNYSIESLLISNDGQLAVYSDDSYLVHKFDMTDMATQAFMRKNESIYWESIIDDWLILISQTQATFKNLKTDQEDNLSLADVPVIFKIVKIISPYPLFMVGSLHRDIWIIQKESKIILKREHYENIVFISAINNKKYFVSEGLDKKVILWSLSTHVALHAFTDKSYSSDWIGITDNDKYLVVKYQDSNVNIFKLPEMTIHYSFKISRRHNFFKIFQNYLTFMNNSTLILKNVKSAIEVPLLDIGYWNICNYEISQDMTSLIVFKRANEVEAFELKYNFDEMALNDIRFSFSTDWISNFIAKHILLQPETEPFEESKTFLIQPYGVKLLHIYSYFDLKDNLEKALELGVQIIRDIDGFSPIGYAIMRNSNRCIDLILNFIAETNESERFKCVSAIKNDIPKLFKLRLKNLTKFLSSLIIKSPPFSITKAKFPSVILSDKLYFDIYSINTLRNTDKGTIVLKISTNILKWDYSFGLKESLELLESMYNTSDSQIYQSKFANEVINYKWDQLQVPISLSCLLILFMIILMCMDICFPDHNLIYVILAINFILTIADFIKMKQASKVYMLNHSKQFILHIISIVWCLIELCYHKIYSLNIIVILWNLMISFAIFKWFKVTRSYIRLFILVATETFPFLLIFLFVNVISAIAYLIVTDTNDFSIAFLTAYFLSMNNLSIDARYNEKIYWYLIFSTVNTFLLFNMLVYILDPVFDETRNNIEETDLEDKLRVIIEIEHLLFWKKKKKSYFMHLIKTNNSW